MSVASALAKIALSAAKNSGNIIKVIDAAGTVVAAANILMEQAKPLMEDANVRTMANNFKANAANAAKGAGNAAASATGEAANKVGALFDKLGGAKDEFVEGLAHAKSEKELKKAIRDARQSVLENATTRITVADLTKAKEKAASTGVGPLNTMPGCFVIATYKKFDKDLAGYINLFIGKAENVSAGVDKAISREGDPDVYADVKYKQNVHVYVYNCMPEDIDHLFESLTQTFSDTTGGGN